MFHDLDSTLEELLRRQLPPDVVEQVTITFATPISGKLPTSVVLPAINFFLYQIDENRDLRSEEPIIRRQTDGSSLRVGPVRRIDCSYLITAWAKDSVTQPERDEHRLLGDVVRVLLRFRHLPSEALQGSMVDQVIAPPAHIFQINQQTRGDFWRALGDRPKAAFTYVVGLAVTVEDPKNTGPAAAALSI